MNVTIIGPGNMARGIGTRLLAGGHHIELVGNDPGDAEELASQLQDSAVGGSVRAGREGQLSGDVVVFAVPWPVGLSLVEQYAAQLDGKIIVDISNPIDFNTMEPAVAPGSSGAEEIAKAAPPGAAVVKAFNTTFAGTLVAGEVDGHPLDVFIAGDDQEAKRTVAQLVRDGGLHAINVGPLARTRQLEGLGFLGISLQEPLNTGYQSAWKLIMPKSH